MSRPGHGPDGSPQGQDFAEFLRHALHAAADQVEPRPDGLERIRARVRAGTAFTTEGAEAPASAPGLGGWIKRHSARLGRIPAPAALADKASGPGRHGRSKSGQARPSVDWRQRMVRPVVAVACAVFAIGVALSLPPLRAAFVQLGSSVGLSSQHSNGATSPSSGSPGGVLGSASSSGPLGLGSTPAASASPKVTVCPPSSIAPVKPATKPSDTVSPATSPQVTPSAPPTTPSPSTSSPAGTVSPSSGVTTSGSPVTTATASATPSATSAVFTKSNKSSINATAKDKTAGTDCVSSSAAITPAHSAKAKPAAKPSAKGRPSATAEASPTSSATDSTGPSGGSTGISNGQDSASTSDPAAGTDGSQTTSTAYPHRHR